MPKLPSVSGASHLEFTYVAYGVLYLVNMKLCEVECYVQRFCILYSVNIRHTGHVAGTCSVGITNSSIAMIISLVIFVVWVQQ